MALLRLTVKVAVPAFSFTVTAPMLMLGVPSLSSKVARPLESPMLAPPALLRFSAKDSVPSKVVSSSRLTVRVWLVTPGLKVSVPDLAV